MKKGILLDENNDLKINVVRDKDGKILSGLYIGEIDYPISAEFEDIENLSKAINPELPFYNEMKQEILKFQNEFTKEAGKHNFEIATHHRAKAKKLENQNVELQNENIELEKDLSAHKRVIKIHQQPTKAKQPTARTLYPTIEQSQILQLYEALKGIFEATPEQWRALFSQTEIKLIEPIKAVSVADIALFLVQLYNYKFIKTNEYAAICGSAKAFSYLDKDGNRILATKKSINATKERSDWWKEKNPVIGLNYSQINRAVASL